VGEREVGDLPRLAPVHRWDLRQQFQSADNLDRLQDLICFYLKNFVLPTCPSTDPETLKDILVRRLGKEIRTSIIKKLKLYFPNDARRNESRLLAHHVDRGIDLTQQALSYFVDVWTEDQRTHKNDSSDTIVIKCQRLLPRCADLPNLRGRSNLGRTSHLFGLVIYEDAYRLLHDLPRLGRYEMSEREGVFFEILADLKSDRIKPRPPECIIEPFFAASKEKFANWKRMSRNNIALEIVAKVMGCKPAYFLRTLKKLHAEASTLAITPLKAVL